MATQLVTFPCLLTVSRWAADELQRNHARTGDWFEISVRRETTTQQEVTGAFNDPYVWNRIIHDLTREAVGRSSRPMFIPAHTSLSLPPIATSRFLAQFAIGHFQPMDPKSDDYKWIPREVYPFEPGIPRESTHPLSLFVHFHPESRKWNLKIWQQPFAE